LKKLIYKYVQPRSSLNTAKFGVEHKSINMF